MTISYVTASAVQWGIVVELTDVLMLTIAAPVFQEAIKSVADVMERLDDKLLHDALLSAANVFFPVKTYTARSSLTTADVPSTKMVRRIVAALRLGTTKLGAARPVEGNNYVGCIHEKHVMDFQADVTWDQYAARLNAEALENAVVNKWEGVNWYSSNFFPEYVDIGNATAGDGTKPTLANNTAVTSTVGLNGFTVNFTGSDGNFASAAYFWQVVRRDVYRGIAEGISQGMTLTAVSTNHATVTAPSTAGFVYDVYQGPSAAVTYLVASGLAPSGTVTLFSPALSGILGPAQLNTTSSAAPLVLPGYIFGKDAYAVVDLDNLQTFVTPLTPSDPDPLVQRRKIGAKFMLGQLILQDKYMRTLRSCHGFLRLINGCSRRSARSI